MLIGKISGHEGSRNILSRKVVFLVIGLDENSNIKLLEAETSKTLQSSGCSIACHEFPKTYILLCPSPFATIKALSIDSPFQ